MIGASRASSTRDYIVLSTTNITSTGSQNYTVPEGTVFVEIEMYGGGGGGGAGKVSGGRGSDVHLKGGGGGGGAYVRHKIFIPQLVTDAVINFTVGAGGAGGGMGGTQFAAVGVDGGDTTLNNIVAPGGGSSTDLSGPSAGGGSNGHQGGNLSTGSQAGTASGGNITNTDGSAGVMHAQIGGSFSAVAGGDGGDAGGPDGGDGGDGGITSFSGKNYADVGSSPGGGGGGGATTSEVNGGAGADGKVIVKAFG